MMGNHDDGGSQDTISSKKVHQSRLSLQSYVDREVKIRKFFSNSV